MPKYYSKARGKSKAFFAVLGKIILSKPGALLRPGRGVGTFGASRAPPPTRGMTFHVVGAAIGRPVCEANNRMRQQTIQPGALLRPGRGVGTFGASRAPPPTRGMPFHVVGAAIGRPVCEANNRPQGDPAACVVRTRSRHWGVRGVEGAAPYAGNGVPCRSAGYQPAVCAANNRMRQQTIQPGALFGPGRGVGTSGASRAPPPTRGMTFHVVGTSSARPVCEANNRMRQQTIQPRALFGPGRGIGACGASRAPPPTRGMPFHAVGAAIGRPVCEANNRPQGDPAGCVAPTRSRRWNVRGVEGAAPYTGNGVPCRSAGYQPAVCAANNRMRQQTIQPGALFGPGRGIGAFGASRAPPPTRGMPFHAVGAGGTGRLIAGATGGCVRSPIAYCLLPVPYSLLPIPYSLAAALRQLPADLLQHIACLVPGYQFQVVWHGIINL